MNTKRIFLVAALSAATFGVLAGGASAETRWERHHPRQDQVLDRDANLRRDIRDARRDGDLTAGQAHRLMRQDRMIAREDRLTAKANGGFITKREQRNIDRQETALSHKIPG